jgi:hypothetical protein
LRIVVVGDGMSKAHSLRWGGRGHKTTTLAKRYAIKTTRHMAAAMERTLAAHGSHGQKADTQGVWALGPLANSPSIRRRSGPAADDRSSRCAPRRVTRGEAR